MRTRQHSLWVILGILVFLTPQAFGELRAHYTFEEGNANDSSGNELHAQMKGNATVVQDSDLVSGVALNVAEVSGGDDVIVSPGITEQEKVSTLTMALWIKPKEANFDGELHALMAHTVVPWVDGTIHFMINGRNLQISVKNSGQTFGTTELEADEWAHAALVRDGNEMVIYLDGVEDARVTDAREITTIDGFNIGAHANSSRQFQGRLDDVRIYDHALTAEEILAVSRAPFPNDELASSPSPIVGDSFVDRDVELSWKPGKSAVQHDIYFGDSLEDVNTASPTQDPGNVYQGQQDEETYSHGRLAFAQTYYWRVDEIAEDDTVTRGTVWSFTVEPYSHLLSGSAITASASDWASDAEGPENTINRSGLDANDLHGTIMETMWLTSEADTAWIQYKFDKAYKLDQMLVWNHNNSDESDIGFGIKETLIELSLDGDIWTALDVNELNQAPGTPGYAANTTVDMGNKVAQFVKITSLANWGADLGITLHGLSEVQFYYIPTYAIGPDPESGSVDVAPDVTLSWQRSGREAVQHEVYMGTTPDALELKGIVFENRFDTVALDLPLGQAYYWQVQEVNEAMDPSIWAGDLWNFTTADFLVVDDFEDYDIGNNEIWWSWKDGLAYAAHDNEPAYSGNGTGSAVGDETTQSYTEETIVHGGQQSMPMHYDNSTVSLSEATRTFEKAQNWTGHGTTQGLVLWIYGPSTNTLGQLYVKINDQKIVYNGDAENLKSDSWQRWYIPRAQVTTDLTQVVSLTIGIDNGGQGVVYVDDIGMDSAVQ